MKNFIILCTLLLSYSSLAWEEAQTFSELGVDEIFKSSPVDDPDEYPVPLSEYEVQASPFFWVIPGPGSYPAEISAQRSNNNVAIEFHQNRLFMAFRSGPRHFASKKTRIYVISTADGENWELEWKSSGGRDALNPQLLSYKGELHLYYVSAGKSPFKFQPQEVLRSTRSPHKLWSEPLPVLTKDEVPWEIKVRDGSIWMTSYTGSHLRLRGGSAKLKVHLKSSQDGKVFKLENEGREAAYVGGVSEAGFEFDEEGNLWSITRNEDGDESGFGSHLAYAPNNLLSYWSMLASADSYQSPRMFRHGKDIYFIARRHKGKKPYDWAQRGGYIWRRILNWGRYSLTPKATALFKLNQEKASVEHVMDLPGAGDTAFPSIRRVNAHTFLVANYTSPLKRKNRKWIVGQLGKTKIYLITLKFAKKN